MDTYLFLQHYWWFLISLLGGLLVFLLFVQGGQGMLYTVGKSGVERDMIVNALGRKWETTFTTLVTFGGAFFASFPLFYSTSFGGAFYVWMLILLVFVIQAVAYEFRRKAGNLLGEKTYEWFLMINGVLGALLLGVAVGTFFTGANFTVDRLNLANVGGDTTISQWTTPWRGLDALADYRNWALGLAVLFLSRVLGAQYFLNTIDDKSIRTRSRWQLWFNGVPFVLCFLLFLVSILLSKGWAVDPVTGVISIEPYKYWHNLLEMPGLFAALVIGILAVLFGVVRDLWKEGYTKGIWFSGSGTVVTVVCLFLLAGYNNTAYYPSLADMQSSLTIRNSSSSEFTLTAMSIVSVLIPFVAAYIWYVWRAMNRKKITREEILSADEELY